MVRGVNKYLLFHHSFPARIPHKRLILFHHYLHDTTNINDCASSAIVSPSQRSVQCNSNYEYSPSQWYWSPTATQDPVDLFGQDYDANAGDVLTMSLSCPHNDLTECKAYLRLQVSPTLLSLRRNTCVTSTILPSPRRMALAANASLLASVSTVKIWTSSMVKHPTIHHIAIPLFL